MKILVLGAGGMAGHVVAQYLIEKNYEVETLSNSNKLNEQTYLIDVTNLATFEKFLNSKEYDIVINCIGVLIKQSELRKDLSTYLNAYLPHYLENLYKTKNTKVVHLSTDCVFSGENAPYNEDSLHDGQLFYDRTKSVGEIVNDKDLTFRMSIIGPDMHKDGDGLFNWFMQQEGKIQGYTHAIWNGITTIELAKGIEAAIKQDLTGLYHLVPSHSISKYDLLKLFKEVFERTNVIIEPNNLVHIDKTLINNRKDFDFTIDDYPSLIRSMKQWVRDHAALYPHYEK